MEDDASAQHDPALPRARVLLADDEHAVLRVLAIVLSREGFEVEAVSSGAEALAALSAGAFDVLVSDVGMPGMTGPQLLAEVRERGIGIPVVLLSGGFPELVSPPPFRYLSKPVRAGDLVEAIEEAHRHPWNAVSPT